MTSSSGIQDSGSRQQHSTANLPLVPLRSVVQETRGFGPGSFLSLLGEENDFPPGIKDLIAAVDFCEVISGYPLGPVPLPLPEGLVLKADSSAFKDMLIIYNI